jgi:hypothetical protein
LDVRIDGQKATTGDAEIYYMDRWSSPRTWGGENPPLDGESAYIPNC